MPTRTELLQTQISDSLVAPTEQINEGLTQMGDWYAEHAEQIETVQKTYEFVNSFKEYFKDFQETVSELHVIQSTKHLQDSISASHILNAGTVTSALAVMSAAVIVIHCAQEVIRAEAEEENILIWTQHKLIEHANVTSKKEKAHDAITHFKKQKIMSIKLSSVDACMEEIENIFNDVKFTPEMKAKDYSFAIRQKIKKIHNNPNSSEFSVDAHELVKKIKNLNKDELNLFYQSLEYNQIERRRLQIEKDLQARVISNITDKNKPEFKRIFNQHIEIRPKTSLIESLKPIIDSSSEKIISMRTNEIIQRNQALQLKASLQVKEKKSNLFFSKVNLLGAASILAGAVLLTVAPIPAGLFIAAGITINLILLANSVYHKKTIVPSLFKALKHTHKEYKQTQLKRESTDNDMVKFQDSVGEEIKKTIAALAPESDSKPSQNMRHTFSHLFLPVAKETPTAQNLLNLYNTLFKEMLSSTNISSLSNKILAQIDKILSTLKNQVPTFKTKQDLNAVENLRNAVSHLSTNKESLSPSLRRQ